jgi:hypothetical protein
VDEELLDNDVILGYDSEGSIDGDNLMPRERGL